MLSPIAFAALGFLLGLAFVFIVFLVTRWRIQRRERRREARPLDH